MNRLPSALQVGFASFRLIAVLSGGAFAGAGSYPVVDTRNPGFYSDLAVISSPSPGQAYFGQDAGYQGNAPSYTDNGDGTIADNVTGLVWQKSMEPKCSYVAAVAKADTMTLGGHSDWRVPTIKELYSLILFSGQTATGITSYTKFIDTGYFVQPLGDLSIGEREIDAQTWSATKYQGLTMAGDSTVFGVNFIDGRIKGYPLYKPGTKNAVAGTGYFRMVRGNPAYGHNDFASNGDGTISDRATGLMWQAADDGIARDWPAALAYCENLDFAGHSDWRLPNAKELQSIVDYSRSPSKTASAAIDPLFSTSSILDPDGVGGQFPYFWTSTTHLDGMNSYKSGVYVAFGKAQGKMNGVLMDVHGAGAQRSDPKSGNAANYPQYFGPQGDVQYVLNHARCIRENGLVSSTVVSARTHPFASRIMLEGDWLHLLVAGSGNAALTLRDPRGRMLRRWNLGVVDPGARSLALQGLDLPEGVYLAELRMDGQSTTLPVVSSGR